MKTDKLSVRKMVKERLREHHILTLEQDDVLLAELLAGDKLLNRVKEEYRKAIKVGDRSRESLCFDLLLSVCAASEIYKGYQEAVEPYQLERED